MRHSGLQAMWCWAMVCGLASVVVGQERPGGGATVEELKSIVVRKNIFRPGKTPPPPEEMGELRMPQPLEPQPLRRPFTVLGIRRTPEGQWADLWFDDPSRVEKVTVGDVIEKQIEVLEVGQTYLRVSYAGQEVRIGVGETSNGALERLQGFNSSYLLLGTHATESGPVADVLILRDGTIRMVEKGDRLGEATVEQIESGRVHLVDNDGTPFFIE